MLIILDVLLILLLLLLLLLFLLLLSLLSLIKVWDSLLHYTARHFKDIQSVVEENWMKILHSIIVSRVSKISNNNTLIQLYLNLKTRQSVHQMIIDTITFHGSKALAKELESKKVRKNKNGILIIVVSPLIYYSLLGGTTFGTLHLQKKFLMVS